MSGAFVAHVSELLSALGRVEAIVHDDTLYLKADDESRARFEEARLPPFVYSRKGKRASLNYYRAPAEALESSDAALAWGREALAAALRASAAAPSPSARPARKRAKARLATRGKRRTRRA